MESGGEAIALKLDVTRQDECRAVVDLIVEQSGQIDIWVDNGSPVLGFNSI